MFEKKKPATVRWFRSSGDRPERVREIRNRRIIFHLSSVCRDAAERTREREEAPQPEIRSHLKFEFVGDVFGN